MFLSLHVFYRQMLNDVLLRLKNIHGDRYWKNLEEQNRLTSFLNTYKKMELNIETIFQMTGKVILLALVYSQTRTTQGLINVFKENLCDHQNRKKGNRIN